MALIMLVAAGMVAYMCDGAGAWNKPLGAVGVGHAVYDAVHSRSWLESTGRLALYRHRTTGSEYSAYCTFWTQDGAWLTLYRHRATGAEYLAYVPDATRSVPTIPAAEGAEREAEEGGGLRWLVFGMAFRTKFESSTGVPHILEREFFAMF